MYAFHFLEAERHLEFDIGSGICIESELFVVVETVVVCSETKCLMPFHAGLFPFVEPLHFGAGLHEELHFHLLELAHAEYELAGNNLVAEGFSYLCYAERYLHAAGLLHVEVVDEDALCRLWTQVNLACGIACRSHLGGEHEVELAHVGPVFRSAYRIDDFLVDDYLLEFLEVGALHGFGVACVQRVALLLMLKHTAVGGPELCLVERIAEAFAGFCHFLCYLFFVFCNLVFNENVGAVALLRIAVVYKRVVECIDMAACLPYRRVHEYCRVDAHDVLVQEHHALPPVFLDVVFQFDSVLSVVIDSAKSVIDFTAGEHETVFFAVAHDFLENVFLCHFFCMFLLMFLLIVACRAMPCA